MCNKMKAFIRKVVLDNGTPENLKNEGLDILLDGVQEIQANTRLISYAPCGCVDDGTRTVRI